MGIYRSVFQIKKCKFDTNKSTTILVWTRVSVYRL